VRNCGAFLSHTTADFALAAFRLAGDRSEAGLLADESTPDSRLRAPRSDYPCDQAPLPQVLAQKQLTTEFPSSVRVGQHS
jgi:hypothetical protein